MPIEAQGRLSDSAFCRNPFVNSINVFGSNGAVSIGRSRWAGLDTISCRSSSNFLSICAFCFSIRSKDELPTISLLHDISVVTYF